MRLAEPWWLILLVFAFVPWLVARSRPRVAWPTLQGLASVRDVSARLRAAAPIVLKGLAFALIAVAMARPQTIAGKARISGQGVTIVVALDHSSSMNRDDGGTDGSRLDAARRALAGFVAGRLDDPIGLVVFANYPDLACPPTLDHAFLLDVVRAVRPARAGDDGTNLGDAIVVALDAIKDAPTSQKVLILLTDGRNSPAVPHPTEPVQAATLARKFGVTLHTIAVGGDGDGTTGQALGSNAPSLEGPDRALLERISSAGGGRSFTAEEPGTLGRVFAAIDVLEKSQVQGVVRMRYRDSYVPWAASALAVLVAESLLASGPWRRLP